MTKTLGALNPAQHSDLEMWPRPTPTGGLVELRCNDCGFRSVPMARREVTMWAWMHATGIAGLPGTVINNLYELIEPAPDWLDAPVSQEEIDWLLRELDNLCPECGIGAIVDTYMDHGRMQVKCSASCGWSS